MEHGGDADGTQCESIPLPPHHAEAGCFRHFPRCRRDAPHHSCWLALSNINSNVNACVLSLSFFTLNHHLHYEKHR